MTLSPGCRVGPYGIVNALGAGGMDEVYRAKDARLGRDVALKVECCPPASPAMPIAAPGIAYVSWFKDANDDIWMEHADGQGSPVPLVSTPFNEGQARFSPDGRYFAYASNESGRAEVYVQAVPPRTERWLVSTNGGAQPMWRGDGRELYFLGSDFWITAVPVTLGDAVTVGAAERLFPVTINESPFFAVRNHDAVSPDGQRFLVNSVTGSHTIRVVMSS